MPEMHGKADPQDELAPPLPFAAAEAPADEDVAVIAVAGECDLATMPRLRAVLDEVSRREAPHLVLDLTNVSFIDSTTLSVLLTAQQRYAALGGGIAVACSHPGVRRTLQITRFDLLFPVCESRDEALTRVRQGLPEAANEDGRPQTPGRLASAISAGIVHLHSEYYGRGPKRAKTHLLDNMVVCLLEDGLTTVERTLATVGKEDVVCDVRRAFQRAMSERFKGLVEELTGRKVLAYMSEVNIEPPLSIEVFVLADDGGGLPTDRR